MRANGLRKFFPPSNVFFLRFTMNFSQLKLTEWKEEYDLSIQVDVVINAKNCLLMMKIE